MASIPVLCVGILLVKSTILERGERAHGTDLTTIPESQISLSDIDSVHQNPIPINTNGAHHLRPIKTPISPPSLPSIAISICCSRVHRSPIINNMIQLLFSVIFAEMTLIMLLLFKTPLRKLVIMALDRVKRGRGPVMAQTVAGTILVVLLSSVYSMMKIQNRAVEPGMINPTDQVLMARHLLESSLMGFLLFLALMIDRLHHYIRELRLLRKAMEAEKKQNRGFEDGKNGRAEEAKAMGEEMSSLKAKIKKLESECETKAKEAEAAEANTVALKKQSEGFLLEYDRLLEENQNLKSQLESIDQGLQSESRKSS